jgi:transcriptional regulator with XRE-family HTH domain
MKKYNNEAVREIRKIMGLTQAEFAVMVGASKDAVASWEIGRNQLSLTFARRIALVTGVDAKALHMGISVPLSNAPDGHVYTAEDFERHQKTEWGRSDEEGARQQLEHCLDTMELLLLAAVQPDGERQRHRLPGVMDAFMQWCENTREDFKLGPQIDAQLLRRRKKVGMTQEMRDWRAMARGNPEELKASGYSDDASKEDRETLRLKLAMVPGWAPGRSMKWPSPAVMKLAATGPK